MDNAGQSLFMGGSIHMGSIAAPDPDEEEEEDEEEKRQREAEIQGMLANAFDDLEEDESFVHGMSHYSAGSSKIPQSGSREIVNSPRPLYPERFVREYSGSAGDSEIMNRYPGSIGDREVMNSKNYQSDDRSVQSSINDTHHSQSYDQTPWSDQSDEFNALSYHESARGPHTFPVGEESNKHSIVSNDMESNSMVANEFITQDPYSPDKYRSALILDGTSNKENDYLAVDSSYEQLRLLYEARGREIDRVRAELSKVKNDSLSEVRVLQHQISLLTSENESSKSNVKHMQILLSEKEEMVKKLKQELNVMQKRNIEMDEESKKIKLELETAESTVSSLECQVSQLKAADNLSRTQKMHDDFVKKLRHGNHEEKELLINKLQSLQEELESYQKEVKDLREESKSFRRAHDDILIQKTEATTKLSVTIQTLQKQYEDLLQSHGSQKILELQVKNKSLEFDKERLEERINSLEIELDKKKEEVKDFDHALMLGIFSEANVVEDSMFQLGIKKSLCYSESPEEEVNGMPRKSLSEGQMIKKLKDELKKSLVSNKVKRDEISRLQNEVSEKQNHLRKAHSDLKSLQVEMKEVKASLFKVNLEKSENELLESNKEKENTSDLTGTRRENISLKQELTVLHGSFRNMKQTFHDFSNFVEEVRERLSHQHPSHFTDAFTDKYDKLLESAERFSAVLSDVENYGAVVSNLRLENKKLQDDYDVLEKRIHSIEVKLVVGLKMIETASVDGSKESEYTHAVTILKKVLEDLKCQVAILKENTSSANERNLYLEDQLRTYELEAEKYQQEIILLTDIKKSLKGEIENISKKLEEEKAEALQSCQDTYLKFHEDAMKEMEVKFKDEYENMILKFKGEITRLEEELTNIKNLYLGVCEEKNEMEAKLGKLRTDSGKEELSTNNSDKQETNLLKKEIEELQLELASARVSLREQSKKFVAERDELKGQYEHQLQSKVQEMQDELSKNLEELKEKCSTLDECNAILKQRESVSVHDSSLTSYTLKAELNQCQQNLLDLKDKLITATRLRTEEMEAADTLRETLKKQERQLNTAQEELKMMKEREDMKDHESEQEVQKLTDMIMNLESEKKELEEKFINSKSIYQKRQDELLTNEFIMKKKLKSTEEVVSNLKEVSVKYNDLKRKCKAHQDECSEQITYYKGEIKRLNSDHEVFKEKIFKRVEDYIENIKKHCMACLESLISELKSLRNKDTRLYHLQQQLEEVNKGIKNLTLVLI